MENLKKVLESAKRIVIASTIGLLLGAAIIFLTILLVGCGTIRKNQDEEIKSTLKKLNYRVDYVEYEATNRFCFVELDNCYLKTNSSCQENPSCEREGKKTCWKIHEKCIIDNYRKWQQLEKNH